MTRDTTTPPWRSSDFRSTPKSLQLPPSPHAHVDRLFNRTAAVGPILESAHIVHVAIAHIFERLPSERRATAGSAIDDDGLVPGETLVVVGRLGGRLGIPACHASDARRQQPCRSSLAPAHLAHRPLACCPSPSFRAPEPVSTFGTAALAASNSCLTLVAIYNSSTSCASRRTTFVGRLRVGKHFLHICNIGRCAHGFALFSRFT